MTDRIINIGVDLMGCEKGIVECMIGLSIAAKKHSNIKFTIYGTKESIEKVQNGVSFAKDERCEFVECENAVLNSTLPSDAVRSFRKTSSMGIGVFGVKNKEIDAFVSAGNTGALMALSKILLPSIDGVERPPLCTLLPNAHGSNSVMLDMGAVIGCKPDHLLQFAKLGVTFIKAIDDTIEKPSCGILNIGTEKEKGDALVKEAYSMLENDESLRDSFIGFVEGTEVSSGKVNVIVVDGFAGNIALKTYEGAGIMMRSLLKRMFKDGIASKIGYFLLKPALKRVMSTINPNNYNGAMLLGLDGIVVKSHGSANAAGFANAIGNAYKLAQGNIVEQFKQGISS